MFHVTHFNKIVLSKQLVDLQMEQAIDESIFSSLEKNKDRIWEYIEILQVSHKKFNLIPSYTIEEMVGFVIIEPIILANQFKKEGITNFFEMGAGGGITSIPLLILIPEINGNLNDSRNIRVSFLDKTTSRLGLNAKIDRGDFFKLSRTDLEGSQVLLFRAFGSHLKVVEHVQSLDLKTKIYFILEKMDHLAELKQLKTLVEYKIDGRPRSLVEIDIG
jgi:16S rRNA G527 N7-methylase RsmG